MEKKKIFSLELIFFRPFKQMKALPYSKSILIGADTVQTLQKMEILSTNGIYNLSYTQIYIAYC